MENPIIMDIRETKYDEKQAAEICGLSVRSLQRRRLEGKGPRYLKVGRSVRYVEGDLRSFLEEARRLGGGHDRH